MAGAVATLATVVMGATGSRRGAVVDSTAAVAAASTEEAVVDSTVEAVVLTAAATGKNA
jgi:hypothetical protein